MFKFRAIPDSGDAIDIESSTRDILKWERTTKGASASQLQEPSFTALYKIAWIAATRHGKFSGTLAEFEETFDIDTEPEDEPDPTQSAAPAGT
jgi:hypothetical protein